MATRRVPTDHPNILSAVTAASALDTIVVEAAYANTSEAVNVNKEGLTFDGVAGTGIVTLTLGAGILNVTLTGTANFRVNGSTSCQYHEWQRWQQHA